MFPLSFILITIRGFSMVSLSCHFPPRPRISTCRLPLDLLTSSRHLTCPSLSTFIHINMHRASFLVKRHTLSSDSLVLLLFQYPPRNFCTMFNLPWKIQLGNT